MMQQDHELHASIRSLIESYFSCLHRPVRKNLARLTCAFLYLAWSVRFGYGGLYLTSIARVLPKCKYFDASSLAECMLAVILGQKRPTLLPVTSARISTARSTVGNSSVTPQG